MHDKVSNLHSGRSNRPKDSDSFECDRGPMCLHRTHKEPGLLLELTSIYAFSPGL
jgi:hypothetical protein